MRFVTPRTQEQQVFGDQVKLIVSLVRRRNATTNQVHVFMLEFGIEYPKGRKMILRLSEAIHDRGETMIHGARSALQWHIEKPSKWSAWAKELKATKKPNVVAVVMANKMARMIWVILARNEDYKAVA